MEGIYQVMLLIISTHKKPLSCPLPNIKTVLKERDIFLQAVGNLDSKQLVLPEGQGFWYSKECFLFSVIFQAFEAETWISRLQAILTSRTPFSFKCNSRTKGEDGRESWLTDFPFIFLLRLWNGIQELVSRSMLCL